MPDRKGFKDFLRIADNWIMPPKASVLEKAAIFGSDFVAIAGTINTILYWHEPILAAMSAVPAVHSATGGALVRIYSNYKDHLNYKI